MLSLISKDELMEAILWLQVIFLLFEKVFLFSLSPQAEEERDDMERVKLDNKRILFNLLPAHVAQHFLMSNPRNMVNQDKI